MQKCILQNAKFMKNIKFMTKTPSKLEIEGNLNLIQNIYKKPTATLYFMVRDKELSY